MYKQILFDAVTSGNIHLINHLIRDGFVDVNERNEVGHTPLNAALATINPNIGVIYLLIGLGADVNAPDLGGDTPLHAALLHNLGPELINLLIAFGADINAPNSHGLLPIHAAAKYAINIDEIVALINAGADINAHHGINNPLDYINDDDIAAQLANNFGAILYKTFIHHGGPAFHPEEFDDEVPDLVIGQFCGPAGMCMESSVA